MFGGEGRNEDPYKADASYVTKTGKYLMIKCFQLSGVNGVTIILEDKTQLLIFT